VFEKKGVFEKKRVIEKKRVFEKKGVFERKGVFETRTRLPSPACGRGVGGEGVLARILTLLLGVRR